MNIEHQYDQLARSMAEYYLSFFPNIDPTVREYWRVSLQETLHYRFCQHHEFVTDVLSHYLTAAHEMGLDVSPIDAELKKWRCHEGSSRPHGSDHTGR